MLGSAAVSSRTAVLILGIIILSCERSSAIISRSASVWTCGTLAEWSSASLTVSGSSAVIAVSEQTVSAAVRAVSIVSAEAAFSLRTVSAAVRAVSVIVEAALSLRTVSIAVRTVSVIVETALSLRTVSIAVRTISISAVSVSTVRTVLASSVSIAVSFRTAVSAGRTVFFLSLVLCELFCFFTCCVLRTHNGNNFLFLRFCLLFRFLHFHIFCIFLFQ